MKISLSEELGLISTFALIFYLSLRNRTKTMCISSIVKWHGFALSADL
ncbi:MAG: hypothetical protein KatS3mg066_2441 [Fischerella sp.]|nr:MAG: hypothetical protein KatS3mg066_2441 [Fischerella sp.]